MAALSDLANRTRQEGKATCVFDCPRPVLVEDNLIATHLYLIAQEAVHNAVRHAAARQIEIHLARVNGNIALTVNDDGIGLPPNVSEAKGMGLRIMQYRARMIGGTLDCRNGPDGGTIVTCSVPAGAWLVPSHLDQPGVNRWT